MAEPPLNCDTARLRRVLEDRLSEQEQSELAGHLEACEGCRRSLEGLAAGSLWWVEARELDGESPLTRGPEPSEAPGDWLGFLGPPAGPGRIGMLGHYEIVEVIGRGGMGVVLKAFDPPLGRYVAIKILAPELATSPMARRRFAREAKAVAAIAHEHIVPVHAVDATPGGLPFLVMLLVSGRSLQERIDRTGALDVREVLRIGMQSASGLAAAHSVGLVHRDVKPANILLENGVERVKLTDFGLARAADDASLTQSGVVAGTPQYMAPEQARGEPVDARADLFSLGSVLYTLCTGRPPFRAETTMGVLRRVCDDTPRPIREINAEIPEWLQSIVEKLQAKDPADRFETAAEVAELFGRCLAYVEKPVGPPPFRVDREPAGRATRTRLVAAAAVLLAAVGCLGASEASGVTRLSEVVATVLRIRTSDGTLVLQVDDPEVKVRVDGEDVVITDPGRQEIRLSLRAGPHRVEKVKGGVVHEDLVTITRGGKQTVRVSFESEAAPAAGDRQVGMPSREAQHVTATARALAARVKALEEENRRIEQDRYRLLKEGIRMWRAIPPQVGYRVAPAPVAPGGYIRRFDPGPSPAGVASVPTPNKDDAPGSGTGREPARVAIDTPTAAYMVAVSPDGKSLAVGCYDGRILIVDRVSGKTVQTLRGHATEVRALAYSPDGRTLASAGGNYREHEAPGELKLWDVTGACVRMELKGHTAMVWSVAFSPDGATLASGSWDHTARLWDAKTGKLRAVLEGNEDAVRYVAFSRGPGAGQALATAGFDGVIRFWRNAPGVEGDGALLGSHSTPGVSGLSCIAYSPDGKTLAVCPRPTSGRADEVILIDLLTHRERVLKGHPHYVLGVAFSPDGKTLASCGGLYTDAGDGGEVIVWDATSGRETARHDGLRFWVETVAFTPDGAEVVSAGGRNDDGGEARAWLLSNEACPRPRASRTNLPGRRIWSLAVSPDGKTLAFGSGLPSPDGAGFADDGGALDLWTGNRLGSPRVEPRYIRAVTFSPDGTLLATAEIDGTAKLRDPATGRVVLVFEGHEAGVNGVSFSPDGRTLATAGLDRTVRLWDVVAGRETRRLDGHEGPVYAVAFRPDGLAIASCGEDDTVRLWDAETGATKGVLKGHENDVEAVAFAPGGRLLASASWDHTVRLWDGDTGRPLGTLNGHRQPVLGLSFSPDGKTLATSGGAWGSTEPGPTAGDLKLWDLASRSLMCDLEGHADRIFAVGFTPDGGSLISADWGGTVLFRPLTPKADGIFEGPRAEPLGPVPTPPETTPPLQAR